VNLLHISQLRGSNATYTVTAGDRIEDGLVTRALELSTLQSTICPNILGYQFFATKLPRFLNHKLLL
jgi:hypothetical protein